MIITKRCLLRRTVLHGMGAAIALPLLDSMVPALARARQGAAQSARRFCAIYIPMGTHMAQWTPRTEGWLELSPILEVLAPFKDQLLVVSGLDSREAARVIDSGPHERAQGGPPDRP